MVRCFSGKRPGDDSKADYKNDQNAIGKSEFNDAMH